MLIHIHFDFSTYTLQSKAPEYVLVELFGIMLDNAIEATEKMENPYIQLKITTHGSYVDIFVTGSDARVEYKTSILKMKVKIYKK